MTGISSAIKRDVKVLRLNGVYPNKQTIASGDYPFFRPLYLVVASQPDETVRKFVAFVLSEEGQTIISREGTVNLVEGSGLKSKLTEKEILDELN